MKKFVALLLTLVMAFSLAAPAFAAVEINPDDIHASVEEFVNSEAVANNSIVSFITRLREAIHTLLHNLVRMFGFECPFCGMVIITATPEDLDATLASAKSGDTVELSAGDYGIITLGALEGITLEATEGAVVDNFVTTAETSLKDVTIKGFELDVAAGGEYCMVIDAAAVIENLTIEDVTFTGPATVKNCYGIKGNNTSASMTIRNCTFKDTGYAIYSTAPGGYAELAFEGCTFENIYSWVILVQYGFLGNLTIDGCSFAACEDGISKNGSFDAAKVFTFTNNTIAADCAGHDGKDSKWFELKTATAVIEGNTYGDAEWVPGDAQGIKAL